MQKGRSILHLRGNTALAYRRCQASDGVSAAAEAKKEYPIARTPETYHRSITIDDIPGETQTQSLADQIVKASPNRGEPTATWGQSTDARVVKCNLLRWIDSPVRAASGGAVQLVDIAAILIYQHSAALARWPVPSE